MSRPIQFMPDPCLRRTFMAGEELRVGSLVEFRQDPNDRRLWKLYCHSTPGGDHLALIVGESTPGQEWVEEGEQAYVVQYFGPMLAKVILRAGEKVFSGTYRDGTGHGTPLVSAGSEGCVVAESRFVSAARYVGYSCEDVDLTDSGEDRIIQVRMEYYNGAVAVAG